MVDHPRNLKRFLYFTIFWVVCAFLFNGLVWAYYYSLGGEAIANKKALEFLAGYILEKSLSVDNLFVFYMLFNYFQIPIVYQQRVLKYGIIGAIIMRLILIVLGSYLLSRFHSIIYLFGAFLLLTGIHMLWAKDKEQDLANNKVLIWMQNHIPIKYGMFAEKFFVKENKRYFATPLFVALVLVELSDLVFAIDSISAIFAITLDPFIIWTSNIFAILGLRSLYFLLAHLIERFYLLKYAVALLLIYVAVKILISPWFVIPIAISLMIIFAIFITFLLINMALISNKRISK
jgi:tellurite resistance protein TerC